MSFQAKPYQRKEKVPRRKPENFLSFNSDGRKETMGKDVRPYPTYSEMALRGRTERMAAEFRELHLKDFVVVGRNMGLDRLVNAEVTPHQEELLERGFNASMSPEEDVPLTVGMSMTFTSAVGTKLFREVQEDRKRLRALEIEVFFLFFS